MNKVLRFIDGKSVWVDKSQVRESKQSQAIVSDALGCIADAVDERRADAQIHGFSGVDFKPDPKVPQFYQAHFSCPDQHRRYIEHCGLTDRNSRNGGSAQITPEHLAEMGARMRMKYSKQGG
jgi:hypothetical protein